MSETFLKAKGSSQGIAIGEMVLFDPSHPPARRRLAKQEIPYELKRLALAFRQAGQKLKQIHHPVFESQRLILQDKTFQKWAQEKILEKRINAEWALHQMAGELLEKTPHQEDIHAALLKVMDQLLLKNPLHSFAVPKTKNVILAAPYLTPAALARLSHQNILGFVLAAGGENSHTLILARSLNIPALCGLQKEDFQKLKEKRPVILDGFEKSLVLNPSPKQLKKYRALARKHQLLEKMLLQEARQPALTRDGILIRIEANAELKQEIPHLLKYGAEGIGLFRTEALFWNPSHPPSFEEQTKLYEALLAAMKGRPVTIRTMDVSGEEWLKTEELNPALGLRGIRFGLQESNLLKTQLKAILKASVKGNVKILLPMVSAVEEVEAFYELLGVARQELKRKKIPFKANIPIGVTLEVPAAGLMADILAKYCDFLTIGTNDLMQYMLAVDRDNDQVANLYSPYHPAVWRLLKQTIEQTAKAKKPLLLCGEMGSDPLFLPLLIGLGLKSFSMAHHSIPKAKKIIRSLSVRKCAKGAVRILKLHHSQAIEKELRSLALELDRP